ncbi:MAG: hypothetical protein ACNI25_14015 [Halarcobacter sp.]
MHVKLTEIKLFSLGFVSLILLVVLSGCAGTNMGASNNGNSTTQSLYDVKTPKAFKAKQQVAIGGFKVSFLIEQKMTAKNRGSFLGGGGGMARATAHVKLNGISKELMQTITDQAYKNFINNLKSNGYSIVSKDKLLKNKTFSEVVTKDSPLSTDESMPSFKGNALVFAPSGEKLRLFANQGDGLQAYGWTSPESGFSKAAEELGIPILDVHYVVTFAYSQKYNGRDMANISVGQSIQVHRGSRTQITSGQGGTFSTNIGSISLSKEVVSSKQFANVVKEEKSTMNKVGSVISAGLTVLLGGGERELETYIYNADPIKYKAATLEVLENANKGIVSEMVSLR